MNALRRCAAVSFVWFASLPRGISNWDKTRYDQSLVMFIPGKEAITNWSKYFTAGGSMASQSLLLFSLWWSSSTTTGMSHWPSTTPSWTLACSSLCLNISRCDSSTLHSAQTDAFSTSPCMCISIVSLKYKAFSFSTWGWVNNEFSFWGE